VFIVASFGNGRAAEVLSEREGSAGNTPPSREARQADPETFVINLANCGANQNNVKTADTADTVDTWATQAVAFTVRSGKEGGGKGYLGSEERAMTLGGQPQWLSAPYIMAHGQANAEIVRDGDPSPTLNHEAPIIWHNHQQDGSIRMQGEAMPTVSRHWGTGGNNVPFVGVRRLTPTECERLQGFPDGWTDGQSDTQRYKQLGNAVAVPVVEWIGRRIKAVDDVQP